MQGFSSDSVKKIHLLRLDPGEKVLEKVREYIEKSEIKDGVVVSAIGTLDYCTLHMVMTTDYPVVEHFEKWEDKPLELCSIDGIIADGHPHLHAVISDYKKAYAGHLEEGARVLYLCEIAILEFKETGLMREADDKGILKLTRKKEK